MASAAFCPQCGRQFGNEARFCSACGAQALPTPGGGVGMPPRLVRPRHPRMVAGVCSGIAIHYGWDLGLTRILFVVFLCISLGTGLFAYLAAWLLIPDAMYALPAAVPGTGQPSA